MWPWRNSAPAATESKQKSERKLVKRRKPKGEAQFNLARKQFPRALEAFIFTFLDALDLVQVRFACSTCKNQ